MTRSKRSSSSPLGLDLFLPLVYKLGRAAASPWTAPGIFRGLAKQSARDQKFARVLLSILALIVATGGRLRLKKGHASLFMPLWIYDVCCKLNFITNWQVGASTFCLNALPLQTSPNWSTDINLSPEAIAASPGALQLKELEALRQCILKDSTGWLKEQDLVQLFDTLPPATPEALTGKAFRGRILRCGRTLDIIDLALIQPARILGLKWGKRYRTKYVGDPLAFTFLERLHFPVPAWGNVGMHGITYRGRSHATMAYDCMPWHDMFAVLDDGAESGHMKLLGLWCHREKSGGWFTLTELPAVDVAP